MPRPDPASAQAFISRRVRLPVGLRSTTALVLATQMLMPIGLRSQATSARMAETNPAPEAPPGHTLPPVAPGPQTPLTQDERILHLLDRFTYGPTPGEVERVKAIGVSAWILQQLNPREIDDSALDARLADFPAMALPMDKMMEMYPTRAMVRQEQNGKIGMVPTGEAERAIYNDQIEQARNKKKNTPGGTAPARPPMDAGQAQSILALPPGERFSTLCRMNLDQIKDLQKALRRPAFDKLTDGFSPRQMEVYAAFQNPQGVIAAEDTDTKLLRDIYSKRELNEVMVDFWLNHFSVYMKKSQEAPYFIAGYERDNVRPRALGRFEDLLTAVAMSPAMLNYLDNSSSVGPHSQFAGRPAPAGKKNQASGLNENYARELMELHTLGVGGGYTQKDVTEVAKVFTGWTVGSKRNPFNGMRNDAGMQARNRYVDEPNVAEFDESKHEPGSKLVLGVTIKEGGEKEGLQVLHMLATAPATAAFVSRKIAIRFVSDDPPQALVDRMAKTFTASGGDIRKVLATMIDSPEFWTRAAYRAKVKTPQDFVVSAIRASGASVSYPAALVGVIADLGMPLYGMQTPNGYSMRADPWNNTGSLVSRMNFALALSANRVPGVTLDWPSFMGGDAPPKSSADPGATVQPTSPAAKDAILEARLLHIAVSDRTRQTILNQIASDADQQEATLQAIPLKGARRDPMARVAQPTAQPTATDNEAALAAGLLFGSPEFQRR